MIFFVDDFYHSGFSDYCGIVTIVLDYILKVSSFEIQSCFLGHFLTNTLRKSINPFISPGRGLILLLLQCYKVGFCIKLYKKVDMPLNKETKPNQTKIHFIYWINLSTHTHTHTHTHIYIYMCVCIYVCVCVCVCVCVPLSNARWINSTFMDESFVQMFVQRRNFNFSTIISKTLKCHPLT